MDFHNNGLVRLDRVNHSDCQLILKLISKKSYNSHLSLNIDFEHIFFKRGESLNLSRFQKAFDYLITNNIVYQDFNGNFLLNNDAYLTYISRF